MKLRVIRWVSLELWFANINCMNIETASSCCIALLILVLIILLVLLLLI